MNSPICRNLCAQCEERSVRSAVRGEQCEECIDECSVRSALRRALGGVQCEECSVRGAVRGVQCEECTVRSAEECSARSVV